MAGDWIKMRPSLLTHPKVNGIARFLETHKPASRALGNGHAGNLSEIVTRNVMRYVTVASLLAVWGAANEHTTAGVFTNADLADLDDMAGVPGFGAALASVGWAIFDPDALTVTLPNFNEYNTSGKERSSSGAERQRRYRERKQAERDVTGDVTHRVTVTEREEKRREEIPSVGKSSTSAEDLAGGAHHAAHAPGGLLTPSTLTDEQARLAVQASVALRKIGVRSQPQHPTLLSLAAEGYAVSELVLIAAEKAMRDAQLWNDPDVHPELHTLFASGATQQQMMLTTPQHQALRTAAAHVGLGWIASTLRGRRRDALQAAQENAAGRRPARGAKPSASDNFQDKTYVGTAIDQLPPEFRAAIDAEQPGG